MIRTIVESPYAADPFRMTLYALKIMKDSLSRDEAPYLSHLLYTRVLDDRQALFHELGLKAAQAWIAGAEQMAVYTDHGISLGMAAAIAIAEEMELPIVYRTIY